MQSVKSLILLRDQYGKFVEEMETARKARKLTAYDRIDYYHATKVLLDLDQIISNLEAAGYMEETDMKLKRYEYMRTLSLEELSDYLYEHLAAGSSRLTDSFCSTCMKNHGGECPDVDCLPGSLRDLVPLWLNQSIDC